MSVIDIIAVIILFLLCIPFMIFIIAEVIKAEQESSKERINKTVDEEVAKQWAKQWEDEEDEK